LAVYIISVESVLPLHSEAAPRWAIGSHFLVTRGFLQPDYHYASDDPETVNYEKVLQASRLMYALAFEAANSDSLF
jgi:hypothetical protein